MLMQVWRWFRLCKVFQLRISLPFRARARQLRPGHFPHLRDPAEIVPTKVT